MCSLAATFSGLHPRRELTCGSRISRAATELRLRVKLIPRRVAAANSRDCANFYGVNDAVRGRLGVARQVFAPPKRTRNARKHDRDRLLLSRANKVRQLSLSVNPPGRLNEEY